MPDDLSQRDAQDRSRIDVNEAHEVRYWCERYDVSEAALRKAVADVGVSAQHVGEHLGMPALASMSHGASGAASARESRA